MKKKTDIRKDKGVKATSYRKLTFVIAPGLPVPGLKALKRHWHEAKKDPSYTLITNYDMMVDSIMYTDTDFLRVTAPDIPTDEVTALQVRVDKARTKKDAIIFVNYDLQFELMPRSGVII
jgi:hypothetical protein